MAIAETNLGAEPGRSTKKTSPYAAYLHLLLARLLELKREPEVIFWIFVFPLLLALGLGIAFRNKPTDVTYIAVVSGPGSQHALELIERSTLRSSIRATVVEPAKARQDFRLGHYDLILESLPDGGFRYFYDPARIESVLSRALVDDALQRAAGRRDSLPTSSLAASEPGARYIDFLVPGLLGMNIMNAAMWGLGFALVEMRQRKLLKLLVATPMRRSDFLLALMTSRLLLMLIQVGLLLGFGRLIFRMRIMGSLPAILLIATLGALSFAGVGLLTASRAQKIESVSGLINFVMLPMWIFSGVFFSYDRFPAAIQPFIRLLPLTALNDALRATILQGSSLASQGGPILVLLLWGGLSFLLALRWFRWT